ncbi:hypothetical protein [Virgifigura deserti]|uniref:hypothetical protein n=1 Tax=Virgifigura deserti TaxID=2268457 RepID=UPI003CCC25B4
MNDTTLMTDGTNRRSPSDQRPLKPPFHPYLVLAVAIALPGMGQVVNGTATRGLTMAFSMLSLGWVSYHLTTPEHSLVGRFAGGFFIYAISVLDAYRWARYRWEIFHRQDRTTE